MDDVMTGRDLILYILEHKLEDKPINEIGCFSYFITAKQAAAMWNVGEETVKTWFAMGKLSGIQFGKTIYINPSSSEYVKSLSIPTAAQANEAFMRRNCKL